MTHVQERSARTQPASLKTEETFVGVQSYRQTLEVIVGYRIALLQCQLFFIFTSGCYSPFDSCLVV